MANKAFWRKWILILLAVLVLIVGALVAVVDQYVEPALRNRLRTLVVAGSDSLYTYDLEDLNASFLGARVEVKNLRIRVDSARYNARKAAHTLPSLTLQLDLGHAELTGISVLPLVFGRKVRITSIESDAADLKLFRHGLPDTLRESAPLWKAIRSDIAAIDVQTIRLNGIKMLYRYADTAGKMKLQFDRCDALLEDLRIDSASAADTGRLGFVRHLSMRFEDLKFRTPDSTRKMKAGQIMFSSRGRTLELTGFKLQPTLEDAPSFYASVGMQKGMEVIEMERIRFHGLKLDQFLHRNQVLADSLVIIRPSFSIFVDKGQPVNPMSKVGRFPHQLLLRSDERFNIGLLRLEGGTVEYREQTATGSVGRLGIENLQLQARHLTNDPDAIRRRSTLDVEARGRLLEGDMAIRFRFHLDSANGAFSAQGNIQSITGAELNRLSVPLAGIEFRSMRVDALQFRVWGNDYGATSLVDLRYGGLNVALRNKATGAPGSGFLSRIVNQYVTHTSNPGPGGLRPPGKGRVARPSFLGFFGLLWKAIFSGMQEVIVRPPE